MKNLSESAYSHGRSVYQSSTDQKYQHEKVVIRVAGGVSKRFAAGPVAKTQFNITVNDKLIHQQPVEDRPFIQASSNVESSWVALQCALAEFVDRATSRWENWEENAGNLGWKLEILCSNETFLEDVEEAAGELDDCFFQYPQSRCFDFKEGSKNLFLLFSEIRLRLWS